MFVLLLVLLLNLLLILLLLGGVSVCFVVGFIVNFVVGGEVVVCFFLVCFGCRCCFAVVGFSCDVFVCVRFCVCACVCFWSLVVVFVS